MDSRVGLNDGIRQLESFLKKTLSAKGAAFRTEMKKLKIEVWQIGFGCDRTAIDWSELQGPTNPESKGTAHTLQRRAHCSNVETF